MLLFFNLCIFFNDSDLICQKEHFPKEVLFKNQTVYEDLSFLKRIRVGDLDLISSLNSNLFL